MKPQDIKIIGVTVTYNNEDKIPYVMPYYERIGIDKLVVYDNGSTDKTVEMLSKYPFVEIRQYETKQYDENLVMKYKMSVQEEFKDDYDWCISTYFDEVFYSKRDFREVLYEKMCEGKTYFMKTGLNLFSRKFPPVNNGKLAHENIGVGSLWTSDDGIVGIYGNKVQLFNIKKTKIQYNHYGCHDCLIYGVNSSFEDEISFFHLKFLDYDFIVRSSAEYAGRMGNNGITCYDFFAKNMAHVYELMGSRAISCEKYMNSTMMELSPEQVIFISGETDKNKQKHLIDLLKIASDNTVDQQYGLFFYNASEIEEDIDEIFKYAIDKHIKTFFTTKKDKIEALKTHKATFWDSFMIRDPWICESDENTFLSIENFKQIGSNLKKEHLKGNREYRFSNLKFERFSRFISNEKNVSLGCYMIVKNEEENIKKCVDSIIDLCDEIAIVDTGCSDKTMDIVKAYGSDKIKAYNFEWNGNFSDARNFAMSKITDKCEFSFTTDADEVFTDKLRRKILELKGDMFNNFDCIDIYLLNYNGTDNISTYVGGRQIVKTNPNNTWRYKVHEKLYFKRNTFDTIQFGCGYILHKHGNNGKTNYNKYAEYYYADMNMVPNLSSLKESAYGAHYFYYLFHTLKELDYSTAKLCLCEIYNKDRILSYTEDLRMHLYVDGYISFQEFFVFSMIKNCNDNKFLSELSEIISEDTAKYSLLKHIYDTGGENHLNENGWVNLAYISYKLGYVDDFIKFTTKGYANYPDNDSIKHNIDFVNNYVFRIFANSQLVIDTRNGGQAKDSLLNFFSHMFKNIIVKEQDKVFVNPASAYVVYANKQISRMDALKEFENIMYGKQSMVIYKY